MKMLFPLLVLMNPISQVFNITTAVFNFSVKAAVGQYSYYDGYYHQFHIGNQILVALSPDKKCRGLSWLNLISDFVRKLLSYEHILSAYGEVRSF